MKKLAVVFVLLIMLLVVPMGVTHAAPAFDRVILAGETVSEDLTIWGGSLKVEERATVVGDVSVFGGKAVLNGHVEGDVVIFGGEASLAGTVDGDLVLFGGTLSAGSSAGVDGDCVLIGGTFEGDGAGNISCDAVGDFPAFAFPDFVEGNSSPSAPDRPRIPSPPKIDGGRGFFGTISAAAGQSLVFGILALVAAAVLPNHLGEVSRTLKDKPAASGAVGFLTLIATVSAIVLIGILSAILMLVCIGFLGIPIVIALAVGLGAALLLGWIAAGTWLGGRLAGWLKLQNQSLTVTTALGTAVLTLAAALLSAFPFLLGGWLWSLLAFLVACAGLGAVALTRFGTRPYPVGGAEPPSDKVAAVVEMLPDDDDEMSPQKPPVD
jgi:hypothetical protein